MITVHLTGGLGNQFFQILNALSLSNDDTPIEVECEIGKPNCENLKKEPTVSAFTFPREITFVKKRSNVLVSKNVNLLLRLSARTPEPSLSHRLLVRFFKINLKIVLLVAWRKNYAIAIGKGLGYSELSIDNKRNNYLIGYFQSFKRLLINEKIRILKEIKLDIYKDQLTKLATQAKRVKPLMVHVRLGDYKSQDSFGVLSPEYYVENINQLMKKTRNKEIWIFSNEFIVLEDYVPCEYLSRTRLFIKIDDSDAATFELMRYGNDYIIANSTFSLCAAILSYSEKPQIVAPDPWFKGTASPSQIIPETWKLSEARFNKSHEI